MLRDVLAPPDPARPPPIPSTRSTPVNYEHLTAYGVAAGAAAIDPARFGFLLMIVTPSVRLIGPRIVLRVDERAPGATTVRQHRLSMQFRARAHVAMSHVPIRDLTGGGGVVTGVGGSVICSVEDGESSRPRSSNEAWCGEGAGSGRSRCCGASL